MNRGRGRRDRGRRPDAVVAKGDLTAAAPARSTGPSWTATAPPSATGCRAVRGNHDVSGSDTFADDPVQEVELPGVALAILDTAVPGQAHGPVGAEQLAWLDELGAAADRPVLVLGHHHVWNPDTGTGTATYYGIDPDASAGPRRRGGPPPRPRRLLRRAHPPQPGGPLAATGGVPWVEVAASRTSPGRGPSTGCSRAASSRCSTDRRPRCAGVDRADPGHVRRRVRRVRLRRAGGPMLPHLAVPASVARCRLLPGGCQGPERGSAVQDTNMYVEPADRPAGGRLLDGGRRARLRPLPGRLRRRRGQGRAPRRRRHHPRLGWRDPRDGETLWWKCSGRASGRHPRPQGPRRPRGDAAAVRRADVLVENFRPGTLERLGLGPDVLLAAQPPPRRHPGDRLRPGRSVRPPPRLRHAGRGDVAASPPSTASPTAPPLLPPIALTDEVTALVAAFATMVALHSGVGQVVDVNLWSRCSS